MGVVPEDEENEEMKKKSRHGVQVLVLERKQYDLLCADSFIDLISNTEQYNGISLGSDIDEIAQQRKQENRENLLAGRAMNRLRSMRKTMGEVKTKDEKDKKDKKDGVDDKNQVNEKSDFSFDSLGR